jgi:DNA mismatch repair protein MutS
MVADLVADPELRGRVATGLRGVGDLERLVNRVGQRLAAPRDLLSLRSCLVAIGALRGLGAPIPGARSLLAALDPCPEAAILVEQSVADPPAGLGEGAIRKGFSAELDDLDASTRHAREWIAGLETKERAATGIRSLKVGYNKVFGYYLEVSNANREQVPASYIRKQTLVGAERYITPEMKEYEALVLGAQERTAELEAALFRQVCSEVAAHRDRLLRTAGVLAQLDVYTSLAEVAVRNRYVRPTLTDGPAIRIVGGRHPVVELARRDVPFVPNDVWLSSEDAIASGAPGGRSTLLGNGRPSPGPEGEGEPDRTSEGTDEPGAREASMLSAPSEPVGGIVPPTRDALSSSSASSPTAGAAPEHLSAESVAESPSRSSPSSGAKGSGRAVDSSYASARGDCAQIAILTGPNMAGKSTYLRQVALIVLMAQIGSFVPAERAEIGLVDRIFTRIGAQDDLGAGQSTFLLEMLETANLLTQSTSRSLLILDEVGRGTSTYDGLAIAQAVVEHIHNHPRLRARTLFATHYHELTDLERVLPRVRNFRVDVREEGDGVVFLHRVVRGAADRSYGVHVARLAGIPRGVTRRAEEILKELEAGRRGRGRRRDAEPSYQLILFGEPHPVIEELKALDVLSLTPLEAITRLFELQQKARTERQSG